MKKVLFLLFSFAVCLGISAQEDYFVPTTEGTVLTYKHFDGKGKPEKTKKKKEDLWTKFTVDNIANHKDSTVITMNLESNLFFDIQEDVPKEFFEDMKNLKFKVANNTLYFDNIWQKANQMMNAETMKSGVEVNLSTRGETTIPLDLSIGQALPDQLQSETIFDMNINGMKYTMKISSMSKDRKVEAKEDILTPAGTFNCYKIVYMSESTQNMGFINKKNTEKVIEWFSQEIGMVKTETYNEKGKLMKSTVLNELKR